MEFVRRAINPWGEEILVGLGWDVLLLVVVAGALFVVVHALFARTGKGEEAAPADSAAAAVPEKVERHGRSARVSHWILALATIALLVTGFFPILGIQFPWVTIHWIAGLVLTGYLVYHVVDTVKRGTLRTMWFEEGEMEEAKARTRAFFSGGSGDEGKPGKWGTENKAFHHVTALAGIAVIATGLLMMARVDTWFWQANPYAMGLSDQLWGWIYVLHGFASVGFVGLLMAHIYFAVRPDKLWITRSMFKGWITREEYLAHHDPRRWSVTDGAGRETPVEPAPGEPVGGAAPTAEQSGD